MTKGKKRKKCDSSAEEDTLENTGRSEVTGREEERASVAKQDTEDIGKDSLEKIKNRVEIALEEMDDIRSRCNGKISGRLKGLIGEIKGDVDEVMRRAIAKEIEAESLKKEVEILKAGTEGLRKDFESFVQAFKGKKEVLEFRDEIEELRKLKKEFKEWKERQGGAERWDRREGTGASSTPIAGKERKGRMEAVREEDRIEAAEEGAIEEAEQRAEVSYANMAGGTGKKVFGRCAATEVTTKAVVAKIPEEKSKEKAEVGAPLPLPQRVRGEGTGRRGTESERKGVERKASEEKVETVRIRSQEAYSELVEKIRNGADPRKSEDTVLSSKKDTGGSLILKVREKEENTRSYREELAKCQKEDSKVEKVQRLGHVHVFNLDPLATEEELAERIREVAGIGREEARVTSLRPAYGESQKATVKLPKEAASRLAKIGRVMVGYVAYRVYVRSFEERCYKCGGTGHIAAKCENSENIGKCFRCGTEGHFARECRREREKKEAEKRQRRRREEGKGRVAGEPMQEELFEV